MNKVNIKLESCYGIKKLEHQFDFTDKNIFAIYAPNGVMKTSFAKTFKDVSEGKETSDRVYLNRKSIRIITDENENNILPQEIFVIDTYNQEYKSEKVSTLLVNKELRKEYESIYEDINNKKQELLKNLKKMSGFRKEIEIEDNLSQDISNKKEIFIALNRVKDEVTDYLENPKGFENIQYINIFNDKSIELLQDQTIMSNLEEYIKTYDKLLDTSTFFKKGVFNHNNASDTAKKLKENGWFKAEHSVNININGTKKEISNEAELEEAIKNEKDSIINNTDLQQAFEKLDKSLVKNQATKDFRDYIEKHKEILPELKEIKAFKEKLWIAYLAQVNVEYRSLLELYDKSKERIKSIADEAEKQNTKWLEVINEFNARYSVPFKLRMSNQKDIILSGAVPSIQFDFEENTDIVPVERDLLLNVLSQGEKRALYILNIIFEVEARKESNQNTLFIIDDIADSFDYKNKYAIIEYLKDISKIEGFSLIILTHNFDFYRNASSRLDINCGMQERGHRLYAVKYKDHISLETEKYQNNPFTEWKKFRTPQHGIAAIPFVRNLAEFCGKNDVFEELTCLLHQKTRTHQITMQELFTTFSNILVIPSGAIFSPSNLVEQQIYDLSNAICRKTEEKMELEEKVILSMAIRLKTEKFLIQKINDNTFIESITNNQTYKLIEKYKALFPSEFKIIELIERVNLMTPENIHINSFMYEPILDMSNEHLKRLYTDVSALENT